MFMTKRDLIDEVNKRFPHLSRRDSEVIINAIFDSMVDALAQGDRIEIRGFGSFVVKHRRARQGRNPKSGALVSVAAKRHEKNLSALSAEEYADLNEALRHSVDIVRRALNPGGINLGMNLGKCAGAGVEDHLHWHVVPRWEGDTNFMPVVGETRVIPQHLLDSYDRLREYFQQISA